MTRQFCREKQGKNGPILGKIRHCEAALSHLGDDKLSYSVSLKLSQIWFEIQDGVKLLLTI